MNKQVLSDWLSVLRGGKTRQIQRYLHAADGYCCLGVLVNLYLQEHGQDWYTTEAYDDDSDTNSHVYGFDNEIGILPPDVVRWAGLSSEDPFVRVNGNHYRLSFLNDNLRMNLEEIANVIEVNFS